MPLLTRRALNRAVLDRQLLLERVALPVTDAVERLLGLNAQSPNPPYVALWNRLSPFTIGDLTTAIEDRTLVRSTLMRSTQHVVSPRDFHLIRPAVAALLRRVQRTTFGTRTAGVDLAELVAAARSLLADGRVLTRPELGRLLARRWPVPEPTALGWTVQYLLPVVHPAPSGTWQTYGPTPFAAWPDLPAEPDLAELVRRYLAAFGPATVADARAWSGVAGLPEVFADLRGSLVTYRDEDGRELFDLPGAPLPDPDTPAPVRLVPEFDAPLLAYADRRRVMTDEIRRAVCVGSGVDSTVLVDGVVAATWKATEDGVLTVHPFRRLTPTEQDKITTEALALLAFTHPGRDHEVRHRSATPL